MHTKISPRLVPEGSKLHSHQNHSQFGAGVAYAG